jgi:3-keto-disaccharide hydrolase
MKCSVMTAFALSLVIVSLVTAEEGKLNTPPAGFTALFNGKDLTGWKGLVGNPKSRAAMSKEELAKAQAAADQKMRDHWKAEEGILVFDGKGDSLCTAKDYGDFELYCDWKIHEHGDSGIYLRGIPQVQIWDPKDPNQLKNGADKGSGSLWNNQKNPRFPDVLADKPIGEWNTFHIKMVGDKVTIHLNGKKVVDNVTLENYWERDKPAYATGPIELQNHGNKLYFRNIYVKELK